MIEQLIAALIVANALVCLVCVSYAVCATHAMSPQTKFAIWLAIIAEGLGWFCQALAAIDYFHGERLGWPWFLLAGVLMANTGTAAVFLANRRACACPACPARTAGFVERARCQK